MVELQIPHHIVNARRKVPVVSYSLKRALQPYTIDRGGLLTKTTPIDGEIAKILLDHGYKQLSNFKTWCPVKVKCFTRSCSVVFDFLLALKLDYGES